MRISHKTVQGLIRITFGVFCIYRNFQMINTKQPFLFSAIIGLPLVLPGSSAIVDGHDTIFKEQADQRLVQNSPFASVYIACAFAGFAHLAHMYALSKEWYFNELPPESNIEAAFISNTVSCLFLSFVASISNMMHVTFADEQQALTNTALILLARASNQQTRGAHTPDRARTAIMNLS